MDCGGNKTNLPFVLEAASAIFWNVSRNDPKVKIVPLEKERLLETERLSCLISHLSDELSFPALTINSSILGSPACNGKDWGQNFIPRFAREPIDSSVNAFSQQQRFMCERCVCCPTFDHTIANKVLKELKKPICNFFTISISSFLSVTSCLHHEKVGNFDCMSNQMCSSTALRRKMKPS